MRVLGSTTGDRAHALERLVGEAISCGVSDPSARRAAVATARRFPDPGAAESPRVRAYFWSVVRRVAARDPDSREASARFLLSATIEDLRESGRSAQGVWDEIERAWSGRVSSRVLDEYRVRLIA